MAINVANNQSLTAITALPAAISGGAMTLIKTLTASSSSTLSFVDGASSVVLDSTYSQYIFKFYDIHPATNTVDFSFNMSIDTGSNYNVTKTTTFIHGYHNESDSAAGLSYEGGHDLAQGTGFKTLGYNLGNDNDQSLSGELLLFNPSSTTFVKHFIATTQGSEQSDYSMNNYTAGYGNTTSAVDAIQFKYSSGNIDSGVIKLYGVS